MGGGGIKPIEDNSNWKFQTYRGTRLSYSMLCEPISPQNEYKDRDKLSGNILVNLKN